MGSTLPSYSYINITRKLFLSKICNPVQNRGISSSLTILLGFYFIFIFFGGLPTIDFSLVVKIGERNGPFLGFAFTIDLKYSIYGLRFFTIYSDY